MSSLFSSVVNIGKAALERMQGPVDPNVVKGMNPNDYATIPTKDREGCLVLYGPRINKKDKSEMFDIVAHSEKNHNQSFSLFRSVDLAETKSRFDVLKGTLPVMLSVDPDLCTLACLQQVCDALRANSSLTLAHLSVQLDLKTIITSPVIEPLLNVVDDNGMTPIMIAIRRNSLSTVKYLLTKRVDINIVDNKGNSVYHYAANAVKDIVEALDNGVPDLLNKCNSEGYTPLHIACHNDQPDCVQALLCAGADVNVTGTTDHEFPIQTAVQSSSARCVKEIIQMYPKQLHTQDFKHGGTPLHWAKSKEIIEALIESGCHLNSKNFKGDTALHAMVRHERLDCVLALVSSGANVNCTDSDGNTPLHIACTIGNVTLVRGLLVFEADTTLINSKEETPFQIAINKANDPELMDSLKSRDRKGVVHSMHAVGAFGSHDIPDKINLDKRHMKHSPVHKRTRILFDEVLANKAKRPKKGGDKKKKGGRLLSLDGGGIKGLVLTRMLLSMEKMWQVPIQHCFDFIAGTSTGGILALALSTGKTVMECQSLYFKLKDRVFIDTKPYNTKPLEELLQQTFGTTKMKDIVKPKVMVTATLADRTPPDLHLFRNYQSPQDVLGVPDFDHPDLQSTSSPSRHHDQLVWRAARASGAAPSFFRAEANYVDGGIMSNNPSLDLLTEIAEHNIAQKAVDREEEVIEPTVLLSLGTGVPPVTKTTVVDIFRPDSASDTLKLFMNWDGMGKLMLDSVLDTDGRTVDRCRAWCASSGIAYYRFSPLLITDVELDEKDDKILVDLMWNAMALVHTKRDDVMNLKELLCYEELLQANIPTEAMETA